MSDGQAKDTGSTVEPSPAHVATSNIPPVITAVGFTFSGPLPHPEILRQFEQIVPGSAKAIFEDFEKQSTHRRDLERTAIRSDAVSQIAGSLSSGLIGIMGVAGGLWLAHEGKSLSGLSAVFGTLASLVGVYLYQSRKQDQELRDKERYSQPTRRD